MRTCHGADVEDADSEVYGLGQHRELPSGWRSVGGAAKMIKAAEVQIRQGASMQQLDEFLQELCECYEVDKSLCEVRKSWFQWHVKTLFDLADGVPSSILCSQLCGLRFLQAINPHWDESVHAMVKDMASMPPKTWAKYWSRIMGWEDWMCDPECQVCSLIKMNVVLLGVPGSQLDYFVVSILSHSVSGLHCRGEPAVARLQLF